MWDALLIAYLANATMLVVHEIDSAFWKEWELALACAAGGLFAVIAHSYFLLRGRPQFRHPISVLILAATGLASLAEATAAALLLRGTS
ncbi:MAG: hypothetical protein HY901_12180 [Deltaproteobacteria bacterium]|nr:hypothetical protein [Deltaproteobacteria bacterium]